MRRSRSAAVGAAAIVLAVSACSLDYDQVRVAEEISADVPETIIFDFEHTVVRNGRRAFSIRAEASRSFPDQEQQLLEGIYFAEFDKNEDIVTEGIADRATLYTDTENVEIYEGIEFYTRREEAGLTAEYLFWNDEQRLLTSNPDDSVTLQRDDGSEVEGRGFRADMKYKTMSFERDVQGVYVSEDDDEE
jgi:LPS export ABC transporter protein LptC